MSFSFGTSQLSHPPPALHLAPVCIGQSAQHSARAGDLPTNDQRPPIGRKKGNWVVGAQINISIFSIARSVYQYVFALFVFVQYILEMLNIENYWLKQYYCSIAADQLFLLSKSTHFLTILEV